MGDVISLQEYKICKKQKDESAIVEAEYKEFVRLMRYFVSIQEPQYDVINVYFRDNQKHIVKDKDGNEILPDEEFENEDNDASLFSHLVAIAPRKIYLHNYRSLNKDVGQIIAVFTNVEIVS